MTNPPSRAIFLLWRWSPILIAAGVGAWLRIRSLRWQIFSDDEWHALRTAVLQTYHHLLTDFSVSAAPPLPLIYKLLHETVGLSEKWLRLPMLGFGILILLVLPAVLPKHIGQRTRWTLAALLALSPLLIYFSRYSRPYSISLFLTFVGVLAFYRWWYEGGARHWAALFVVCAIFGPYFHLTTLPCLLSPFPLAAFELWRRHRQGEPEAKPRPSLSRLLVLAFFSAAGLGLLVGTPMILDWGAIAERAGSSPVQAKTFLYSIPLIAGTGRWWLAWALVGLATAGLISTIRRQPRFAAYLLWITLCTVVVTTASQAAAVHVPIVFVRYTLWILPLFLLFIAIGMDRLLDSLRSDVGYAAVLAASAVMLYALGPAPSVYGRVNSWTNHAIYQYSYDGDKSPFSYGPDRVPVRIPEFYHQLAESPAGSLVIVEAPWFYEWHNNPLASYQKVHQQWVKAGFLGETCYQPGALMKPPPQGTHLNLRNSVDMSNTDALGMHGVDYVVLHKNLRAEMPEFLGDGGLVPASNIPKQSLVSGCVDRYRQLLGPVVYDDRDIIVFDVRAFKTKDWT